MILFDVGSLSQLPIVLETARRLKGIGEPTSICYSGTTSAIGTAVSSAAATVEARYFAFEELVKCGPSLTGGLWRSLRVRFQTVRARSNGGAPSVANAFLSSFRERIAAAQRIVTACAPDLLVVCEDGPAANAPLIKAVRDEGIPVLICPYGMGSSEDFDNYLREKHQEGVLILADGGLGDELRAICPQWIRSSDFGDALMFPPAFILAREQLGLSLEKPWVVHGGPADRLAVESEAMLRHYRQEGIAESKLALTGTVYCDVLHDALQEAPEFTRAFADSRKILPGQTSVLLSLPPSYHETRPGTSEFETYEDLCSAVLGLCADRTDITVTLSIHPATLPHHKEFLHGLGLPVSDDWLLRLIPKHDVLLTCFSSTIRWAIACGKPVINYDMYKHELNDYRGISGVITSTRFDDVKRDLYVLTDDAAFASTAARQKKDGTEWGMIDGRNFERVYGLMTRLSDPEKCLTTQPHQPLRAT